MAISSQQIDLARTDQGQQFSQLYELMKTHLVEWQVNCPDVTTMNALGYTDTAKQQSLLQWQANLSALIACIEGTQTAANTHNMVPDIAREKGVN